MGLGDSWTAPERTYATARRAASGRLLEPIPSQSRIQIAEPGLKQRPWDARLECDAVSDDGHAHQPSIRGQVEDLFPITPPSRLRTPSLAT